jgi:hypothetical protein
VGQKKQSHHFTFSWPQITGFGKTLGWEKHPWPVNTGPLLYNVVRQKNVLVANTLTHNPLNIEFRRTLSGNKWDAWIYLVQRLMFINLTNNEDKIFVWKPTVSGTFTVKSMYVDFMNGPYSFLRKYI